MPETIRIAYILTPVDFGGSEKVNLNFLKHVDREKFRISLVLFTRPWEKENVFIRRLEKERYPIHEVPVAIQPRSNGRDPFRLFRCLRMVYMILKKGSFDLVHTHGYFADVVAIPVSKILGIPVISTCHGFIANDFNLRFYNTLDRLVLSFARRIIAVSRGIKRDLTSRGIRESQIAVIQNAVEQNVLKKNNPDEIQATCRQQTRTRFGIGSNDFVVGYIGRLSEEKGVKYLIEASALLARTDVPIKVLIIGQGPSRENLESLIGERRLEDTVFFTGFQNDIESWWPAIDAFALPSLTEGTPMSLLEAMACGVPVIASSVGGVPEVIDSGQNGILVPPGRPDEMTNAIRHLYQNPEWKKNLVKNARKTIESNYHMSAWISKIENEYLQVLAPEKS